MKVTLYEAQLTIMIANLKNGHIQPVIEHLEFLKQKIEIEHKIKKKRDDIREFAWGIGVKEEEK